ncbi:hypothetical protein DPMN_030467 [Dreissena polymorpha]|uniref:Uncharacterized protein n=1 Tax=Dreissena polymorpha TaxID=45954 RepID=A0A9D4M2N5_DREPO|nr:hypothetical protein DPMN_030467 [Dreissena polymorpha]
MLKSVNISLVWTHVSIVSRMFPLLWKITTSILEEMPELPFPAIHFVDYFRRNKRLASYEKVNTMLIASQRSPVESTVKTQLFSIETTPILRQLAHS